MAASGTVKRDIRPSDYVVAAVLAIVGVVGTYLAGRHQLSVRRLDLLGYLLVGGTGAVLVLRRHWPVQVLAVAFVLTQSYVLLDYPGGPIWLAMIVAFGNAILTGHRVAGFVSLVAGYLISEWLAAAIHHRLPSGWQAAGLAAWLLTLLAVSEVVRNRRAYLRAARQQEVDAERSRAEAARRQASEQRLGIARDLHDVLAHSISLINVQAGVALELIDQQPEQARSALAAIKQTSKQALVEVQSVLADLRSPEERAPRTPTPTVADLSDLIESAQAAGLRLSTVTSGDPVVLSSTVALAGYRIVQEALTNVARHAGQVATEITLCYTADSLSIEVTNEAGRRTSQDGTGLGIRGMRDRVTSLGGTLRTGPTVRGGFTIHAVLPATAEQA